MAKLKPGAVTVDLATGGVYGDLDHCHQQDLLESARALLALLPRVRHKGLWGLAKAYDADCYLYTTAKRYSPPEDLNLEAECPGRTFCLTVIPSDREAYWRYNWYSKPLGKVVDGQVTRDTEGVVSHYRPPTQPDGMERCPNCNLGLVADEERPRVKQCAQCGFVHVGVSPDTGQRRKRPKASPVEQQLSLPL